MTDPATPEPEPTTPEPEPEPEPPATTTEVLEVAAEIHARIGMALASTSDAAELGAEDGALPAPIAATVLRALSRAHRYLADAAVLTSQQAVASARVVELATPADASRRVICACGLAFTPAGWELHRTGMAEDEGEAGHHELAGELVAAGPSTRRRAVDVLLGQQAPTPRGRDAR